MAHAYWYFDFISPFAYLQFKRFASLPADLQITPVPVVFGALLVNWGQLGPAEIPTKRRFVYRFFQWNANKQGVPFQMPRKHPFHPLPALRLSVAAGGQIEQIRAIFEITNWQGIQPDAPEGVAAITRAVGITDLETAMSDAHVKQALRDNTEQAITSGVLGVPSFVIDDQVFWGGNATEILLDYLDDPALVQTQEMERISEMPMGLTRQS